MATPTVAPAAPTVDPKQTAANIAKAVTDKAAGKVPPTKGPENPVDDGDEKKPAAAADPNAGKKRYVVNGKEVFLTPEQADSYVQKGLAFEPKVSELDRLQRETMALQRALLEQPGRVLANLAKQANVPLKTMVERVLGSSADEDVKETVGKWYYENAVKLAQMDPKDRELLEKDEKIKRLEAQEKEKAEAAIANENRVRVQQAMSQVAGQIKETLAELGIANVDTPAAVRITKEIADVMRLSYFRREPCTAKVAAEKVRARILDYNKQFLDQLDADKLVEVIGKDNAEKVRKHFLKLVKQQEQTEQKPAPKVAKRNGRETITPDQFHDYLDELKRSSK